MLNMIKTKHYTCYLKDNKLVSAKCNITKRFVKRSIAQVELNAVKRKQAIKAIKAILNGLNAFVVIIALVFALAIYAIAKNNAHELFTLFNVTAITVFSVQTILGFYVVFKWFKIAYSETKQALNA